MHYHYHHRSSASFEALYRRFMPQRYLLIQKFSEEIRFIQCGSATLNSAQKNCSIIEIELQAVLLAYEKNYHTACDMLRGQCAGVIMPC